MIKIDLFEIPKEFGNTEQLNKIKEELYELEIAHLGEKYNRDTIEHVLEEAFDIMQATFTFIRMNVKDKKEIEKANIMHIEKMERRYKEVIE